MYSFLKGDLKKGTVLDIACATGLYSGAFSKDGFEVVGVDITDDLIKQAPESSAVYKILDMRHAGSLNRKFNLIYCIGNSLVHLASLKEIEAFVKDCYGLLEKKGILKIQIVNYDRVISNQVTSLPTIETDRFIFERNYSLHSGDRFVSFEGKIHIDNEILSESINLITLRKDEIEQALINAGFKSICFYGSSKREPWNENSFPLIVEAQTG